MNRSTPGLPVHHQLPEFTQTHVHRASDAIQPSHPLSSPSPPASNPSQHRSLFQWVKSSHEVAKVLDFSFSILSSNEHPGVISFRMDWLDLLAVQGTTRVFSSTTVQKQQFFGTQLSSQSNSHIHTWPLEKPQSWLDGEVNSFVQKQYPKMLRLYYWKSDPRSMVISNPVAILGFWRQESFS